MVTVHDLGPRALSLDEMESVNGGILFVVPPLVMAFGNGLGWGLAAGGLIAGISKVLD